MNEAWREEFRSIRERIHPYTHPLPKRKQRVQARGRSGKVKHYDYVDCFFISLWRRDQKLAREVANVLITLWENES